MRDDLHLAVDVIAQGHYVDPVVEELLEQLGRYPAAPGGVLGVADHKLDAAFGDEVAQVVGQEVAAGLSDHVPDAQNVNGHIGASLSSPPARSRSALYLGCATPLRHFPAKSTPLAASTIPSCCALRGWSCLLGYCRP